jgi:acyl-coenzyme A synthetase/AMP-(fatty) acid ligase/acyl carrier protein
MHWHCAAFKVGEGDRTSSVAAVGFDAATWEIWPSLSVGATLILAPGDFAGDVEKLITWWSKQSLDVAFLPTPLAEVAFSCGLVSPQLRTLLVGGDRLSRQPTSGTFDLVNNYGPTETAVVATSGKIDGESSIHIGRPIANTLIRILNEQRQIAPVGVAGEIYIGGAGVGRGYLNRPELTAERFVADPFNARARLYKTGDLGRWRLDGTIEYLGRNDHQVKIRGFRIELGEIEVQLVQQALVSEAVVIAREDEPGEKRLVAYVVPQNLPTPEAAPSAEVLRAHLKAVLPDYMVPSAFVVLEKLPLTPNGKLDRRALPAPELGVYASRQYEAPQGEVEASLAEIWQGLLRVQRIGRQDNFFELGGHSLHAMTLIANVGSRLNVPLPVVAVFRYPTIQQMAEVVHALQSAKGALRLAEGPEIEEGII